MPSSSLTCQCRYRMLILRAAQPDWVLAQLSLGLCTGLVGRETLCPQEAAWHRTPATICHPDPEAVMHPLRGPPLRSSPASGVSGAGDACTAQECVYFPLCREETQQGPSGFLPGQASRPLHLLLAATLFSAAPPPSSIWGLCCLILLYKPPPVRPARGLGWGLLSPSSVSTPVGP